MSLKHSRSRSTDINRRFFITAAGAFTASLLFASCTTGEQASTSPSPAGASASASPPTKEVIKVGVWFFVADDILKFLQNEGLAEQAGLEIKIVQFNDWIQPNQALKNGDIDANFFQNRPFLEDSSKKLNVNLTLLNLCYLTPMGIYSKKYKSLNDIPSGGTIAIPSDATNGDRALRLLQANNVIKLKPDLGEQLATAKDVAENPKNLQIKEIEGPNLARAVDDLDLSVFATSVRLQAKLDLEPLVQETATASKYAVGLATVVDKENDPKIQKLNRLINDPKVKDFINEKYKGAVIATF
ncbi:MAG TPA: MetQ/NlpA family ABC transporter substrate-binding protein [Crinalium sp.]|jgi:D-methionine transport system substrate-binding protein